MNEAWWARHREFIAEAHSRPEALIGPRESGHRMLLSQAVPGADLECQFSLQDASMRVSVSVLTLDGQQPSRDTFAWTVLSALAGDVDSSADVDNRVTITLHKQRSGTAQ